MIDASALIVPELPETGTIRVPVRKVLDGDGFKTAIRAAEIIGDPEYDFEIPFVARFGFIDAPEIGQPGGDEAKAFLSSLIADRWLDLVVLTKMDTGKVVDRYGRLVCVPFLSQEYNAAEFRTAGDCLHTANTLGGPVVVTRNIELEMVLNGWAWVLERYGPDERYLAALREAQQDRRGIWSRDDNVHPWEYKKQRYRLARKQEQTPTSRACPAGGCTGRFVNRSGKFGSFLGCSNFPKCRYSCSLVS